MAITIDQEPYTLLNLSGNPIEFTFSSDQTGQANFSFYIEVYAGGVLVTTKDAYVENGDSGKINISDVAENYTSPPTLGTSLTGSDAQNYEYFSIKVYERYGDPASLQASATSSNIWAIKGKKEYLDWVNFSGIDYIYPVTNDTPFLTDKPNVAVIEDGETEYLFLMFDQVGYSYFVSVEYYDIDGTQLDNFIDFSPDDSRCVCYAINKTNLEAAYAGVVSWDEVTSIKFQISDIALPNNRTEIRTITFSTEYSGDKTRVEFLSQFGGIDSYTFTRRNKKNISTNADMYMPIKGEWDGTDYSYSGAIVEAVNFAVSGQKSIELSSNWINEEFLEYLLNNLFLSPLVRIQIGSAMVRVGNGNNSAYYSKNKYDQLFNIVWQISLGRHTSMSI